MSSIFNPSSWFNNVFFEKMKNGDAVYSLTNTGSGSFTSIFDGAYSEANMMTLFQAMPELFFAVNTVASRVKNGTYSLVDKDGKTIDDNPLWNQIIKRPNWQFSFPEFIWHAVVYRLVTGNRYGYTYSPSTLKLKHSNIQSLWLLPSHYVCPKMKMPRPSYLTTKSAADYVECYMYNGDSSLGNIPTEYVVHDIYMKMGDSSDILAGKGVSPFKAAEYPLSNLKLVYIARNVIYEKRGPSGAIISAAKDDGGSVAMTPDEKDEVISDLTRKHGVGRGQTPFSITNQAIGYVRFGSTISELEPFKETEASAAALCGILNIPVSLMPKGAEAKFSNLDIAERNLYENTIFAEADSICQFLTKLGHFEEIGAHVVVSFDHISCLQDDAFRSSQAFQNNAAAAQELYNEGHITQNELRVAIGQPPIDGGDDYISEEERLAAKLPGVDTTLVNGTEEVDSSESDNAEPKMFKIKKRLKVAQKLFGNKNFKRKKQNCYGTSQ